MELVRMTVLVVAGSGPMTLGAGGAIITGGLLSGGAASNGPGRDAAMMNV